MGTDGVEVLFQRVRREMGAAQGQMPGREEGRRNSEYEQELGRISQQLVLPAPRGINEGTPASSLELDLPRVRGALGECGGAGKSGTLGDRKGGLSNSPSRRPMEEDVLAVRLVSGNGMRKTFVEKRKRKEKRNRQGKDPRTLRDPVERWRVQE